jgi:histidinol-phosphate aminotransferase
MVKPTYEEIPQHIREIEAYGPGEHVERAERELGLAAVKLPYNENPLGPSPLAINAAKKALSDANRYAEAERRVDICALEQSHLGDDADCG